jgi:glycosyltransferase involved in cell wall biosynthesis
VKIALLAPFEEPVPPEKYGGTERVVHSLAEGLVGLGHDVTLFASGDSHTSARLVPCVKHSLRRYIGSRPRTWSFMQWQGFHRMMHHLQSEAFDVVHNHGDWPFLIANAFTKAPFVTTIHNPKQYKLGFKMVYKRYQYVSISDAQRKYMPDLNYVATVHHGIDLSLFEYNEKPDDYLAFLGRVVPDKGLREAIQIAKATKQKLIIAAKLDAKLQPYFRKNIKPHIDNKQIVFIGEVAHEAKVELLENAKALLSPIQWDEPFGLSNIEAMACGTPVIAIGRGSLPEIVVDGETGYLCKTTKQMAARVADINKIKRQDCRRRVEQHFSASCMAQKYVAVYQKIIDAYPEALQ